jgi:alpha-soluble NSF attachment protein
LNSSTHSPICKHEAATFYVKAAECYKKVNPAEAQHYMKNAISMYCEIGRFSTAGKLHSEMAEMCEDDGNVADAVDHYLKAQEFFDGEGMTLQAIECMKKVCTCRFPLCTVMFVVILTTTCFPFLVAQIAMALADDPEGYDSAVSMFEVIAERSLNNNHAQFHARSNYMNAGLVHLLSTADPDSLREKMFDYKALDVTFYSTREYRFLEYLARSFDNLSLDDFADLLYNYDSVCTLTSWQISVLKRVKILIDKTLVEAVVDFDISTLTPRKEAI